MGKKLKIDAREVDKEIRRGGRGVRVPEGEYKVKINNSEVRKTNDGSGRYIRWECIIVEPKKYKGKRLFGNTSLKKDALWSLRNLIHAATKKNIAGKVAEFDPDSLIGKVVGASVSDNEYQDKNDNTRITSQIDSFFPKDEVNASDDDDEDEDDDEDLDEEDEEEDEDEEEEDEEEEEEKPKKKSKKKATKKKRSKDEDDDEDEDEDLEDVDVEEI